MPWHSTALTYVQRYAAGRLPHRLLRMPHVVDDRAFNSIQIGQFGVDVLRRNRECSKCSVCSRPTSSPDADNDGAGENHRTPDELSA